jgi:hypothetical protein
MEQSPSWEVTGSQLVKKFPAFYGIRRFIIAFTSASHLSLSWARWIQFMPPLPIQFSEDTVCVSISNYSPQEVIHFRVTKVPFQCMWRNRNRCLFLSTRMRQDAVNIVEGTETSRSCRPFVGRSKTFAHFTDLSPRLRISYAERHFVKLSKLKSSCKHLFCFCQFGFYLSTALSSRTFFWGGGRGGGGVTCYSANLQETFHF